MFYCGEYPTFKAPNKVPPPPPPPPHPLLTLYCITKAMLCWGRACSSSFYGQQWSLQYEHAGLNHNPFRYGNCNIWVECQSKVFKILSNRLRLVPSLLDNLPMFKMNFQISSMSTWMHDAQLKLCTHVLHLGNRLPSVLFSFLPRFGRVNLRFPPRISPTNACHLFSPPRALSLPQARYSNFRLEAVLTTDLTRQNEKKVVNHFTVCRLRISVE